MKLSDYRKISPAIYADLKAVFEKHGFSMPPARALVDERLGTVKLTIEIADKNHKSADGSATTPEAERYREFCRQMGSLTELKGEWLNDTFGNYILDSR